MIHPVTQRPAGLTRRSLALAALGSVFVAKAAWTLTGQRQPADVSDALKAALAGAGKTQGGIAGLAVILVTRDTVPLLYVDGFADAGRGVRANRDTAFYVASQTKAYTGLLAARLHREGIFDLGRTIADIWPGIALPPPANAKRITFLQLLSHQSGLESDALDFRTAYAGALPLSDYPEFLSRWSTPAPAFNYSNFGYLIYAAALERETGRNWKSWLREKILVPAKFTSTFTRTSDIAANRIALGHQWTGERWATIPAKTDSIMHAAGGIYATAADTASWLQIHLRGGAPTLDARDFEIARSKIAVVHDEEEGFDWDGYGLGWRLTQRKGLRVFQHGGTYDGCRSEVSFIPELDVGVGVLANSDSRTAGFAFELTRAVIDAVLPAATPEEAFADLPKNYSNLVSEYQTYRRNKIAKTLADPMWDGWAWSPAPANLAPYEGAYVHPAYGRFVLTAHGGALIAINGEYRARLRPAAPGLFALSAHEMDIPEPVRFKTAQGSLWTFTWREITFERAI